MDLSGYRTRYWIAWILYLVSLIVLFIQIFTNNDGDINEILISTLKFGTPYCFIAIGAAIVIATGGIDLSSMGVATLSSVLFAGIYTLTKCTLLSVLVAIFCGFVCGCITGYSIAYKKVPPLIFTWACSIIYFSISRYISSQSIFVQDGNSSSNTNGIDLSTFGISISPISRNLTIGILILIIGVLSFTGITHRVMAIGSNRNSALYTGIKVKKNILFAYIISSMLSALAGIYLVYQTGVGSTKDLSGKELIPIAICVIAGSSLSGGTLKIISVCIASFFWANLDSFVNICNVQNQELIYIIFSAIILLVSLISGKAMTGEIIPIHVEQKNDD